MQAERFRCNNESNYNKKYPTNIFKALIKVQRNEGTRALY